jgi:hypothetical protein
MKMQVQTVEVLDNKAAAIMTRRARWERRKDREDFKNMTATDVIDHLEAGISAWLVALTQNISAEESPLPPISEGQVSPYETPELITLLEYARIHAGRFLLVEFSAKSTRTFQRELRAAAAARNLAIHLETLFGGSMLLKVNSQKTPEESDHEFLKRLRVRW